MNARFKQSAANFSSAGPGLLQINRNGMTMTEALAQPLLSAAVAEAMHPWKAYPAPYVGSDDPPSNQKDRWRIACGILDGNRAPTNRNDEFLLDAEGDNWIWLHLLFAPTLLLTTIELRSGTTLEEGYYSGTGEALVIVPIFHAVKASGAAAGVYTLKVQHAKKDMTSTKALIEADCAMRRMRPALSPSA